ncbi:MAG TPA: serine/threonine-protein kinase, partial [Kofleriaceae bacterium]|nr:serine/threonine-protein kinase [Kofleriaceae bacterium]
MLREHLSSGGFGAVFRAEQPALGREAVIKVLHARLMKSDSNVQRFLREARLASRLDHPYAAHTYAFGAEPDGTLWIAMELVRDTPLDRLLASGPIPLERFVPLLERICEVVHTAHEAGIVHRDLKPANVMVLARAGRLLPKLLDFGIAKIADEEVAAELARTTVPTTTPPPMPMRTPTPPPPAFETAALDATVVKPRRAPADETIARSSDTVPDAAARLTQVGAVMGSPLYMAPEQWSDAGTVSPRSDLYALGVLAFEALTGRPPFTGADILHLAIAHSAQPTPKLGPGFAPELDDVIARAMAKRPEDRFETALDLAAAFRAASGIAADRASLPRLDEALRAAVLTAAPRPIALAVDAFAAARNAHQARDALWRAVHTIVRTVSLIALASHAHVASEEAARDEAVAEALRALRRGGLLDAGWLELARGLVRPFARYPEVHPIPALVELLIGGTGPDPIAALLDLKRGADDSGAADEEEVVEFLEQALPHLSALLARLAFLSDLGIVVPVEGSADGDLWAGVSPERPRRPIAGRALHPGRPLLLDRDGAPLVVLWPYFQVWEPVPGAPPQLFLFDGRGRRGARLVALPEGFERGDDDLWDALRSLLGGDQDTAGATTTEEVPPFPGLAAFTADDAASFTGREREVEAFVNRLHASPLLAVVGPSGAGKSSFVQAGVVPSLPGDWDVITVRPGLSPVASLVTRLAAAGIDAGTLARDLEQHAGALGSALRAAAAARGTRVLLVIDQLEELFTLSDDPRERELFAAAIARAARSPDDPVRVVLTLRDDFLLRAEALPPLRARLGPALQLLTTPAPEDLHRILVEPLRRAGYVFDDPGLPDEIVEELQGTPGALALLSFTASKLWELRDRKFRQISHKAYRSLGGVGGALAQHAEATLAELPQEEKRLVREVFRHAVTAEGTRAVLRGDELEQLLGEGPRARAAIDKHIGARLLVGAEAEGGGEQIEIT